MIEKTLLESTMEDRIPRGLGGRCYGVYPAVVSDVADPQQQGRVKVRLPWAADSGDAQYEAWARMATLMGGKDRGSFFIPDVDDEVLVAFQDGDPRFPYVLGGLWNGADAPPAAMDGAGRNDKKVLKSRNGVTVTLDDADGQETLTLETPGGQKVTLKDGPGAIEIEDSNGNSLKMSASGLEVRASAKISLQAPKVDVSAGLVKVDAGMAKFSGVVKCDTVVAPSVVGSTYTPGAGNVW